MRKVAFASLVLAATACAPRFPDYVPRMHAARYTFRMQASQPTTYLGRNDSVSLVGVLSDVASSSAESQIAPKIAQAGPPNLAQAMQQAWLETAAPSLPFKIDPNAPPNADTQVEVVVRDYGWHAGGGNTAQWHFVIDTNVVFLPENRVVWQEHRNFWEGPSFWTGSQALGAALSADQIQRTDVTALRADVLRVGIDAARNAANAFVWASRQH